MIDSDKGQNNLAHLFVPDEFISCLVYFSGSALRPRHTRSTAPFIRLPSCDRPHGRRCSVQTTWFLDFFFFFGKVKCTVSAVLVEL